MFYGVIRRQVADLQQTTERKMTKFKINPNAISEQIIEADFFKLEGDYFWFFKGDSEVVSIKKAIHVDQIDHLA